MTQVWGSNKQTHTNVHISIIIIYSQWFICWPIFFKSYPSARLTECLCVCTSVSLMWSVIKTNIKSRVFRNKYTFLIALCRFVTTTWKQKSINKVCQPIQRKQPYISRVCNFNRVEKIKTKTPTLPLFPKSEHRKPEV